MPNTKITDLAANTTPATSDLIVMVNDVGGTPANQKMTFASLFLTATPITPTTIVTSDDVTIAAGKSLLFGAVGILVDSPAGTMTLSNIDAIDATTETTLEAAIDSLSSLVTVGALNSGSITSGFGSIDNGASAISGGAATFTTGTFSGVVSVDDTTDTTSGTTGSIHTDGGLGVALKLNVEGNTTLGGSLTMNESVGGGAQFINFRNASTDANSAARIIIGVNAASGASDPYVRFDVTSGETVAMGIDQSDSNIFKWSDGADVGTSDRMKLVPSTGVLSVDGDGGGADDPVALFDTYDDAELAQRFAYASPTAIKYGVTPEQVAANRDYMVKIGVAEWAEQHEGPDHLMYRVQPMMRMLAGGIYQGRALINELRTEIADLRKMLPAGKG